MNDTQNVEQLTDGSGTALPSAEEPINAFRLSLPPDMVGFSAKHVSAAQITPENLLLARLLRPSSKGVSFLEVLPHDVCNHSCSWCFTKATRQVASLGADRARELLDKFTTQGGLAVLFSGGGEPLLAKYLISPSPAFENLTIVGWLANKGIAVGLITNGVFLDRYLTTNVASLTQTAFIRVSLDACTEAEFKSAHGAKEGEFENVLSALRMALQLRGRSTTPAVGISFVLGHRHGLSASAGSVCKIAALARHLSVDFVQLKHVHTPDASQADRAMHQVFDFCLQEDWGRSEFWVHRYLSPRPGLECRIPTVSQVVGAKGDVFPCCHRQDLPLAVSGEPVALDRKVILNCRSLVCRYVSLNEALLNTSTNAEHTRAFGKLAQSLRRFGYHPYRLFPSAPDLVGFPTRRT